MYMKANKVENKVYVSEKTLSRTVKSPRFHATKPMPNDSVSFKGGAGDLGKKFWLQLRRLGNQMKDNNEFQNAVIAAIGTGIIAPAVILVSPGKGDEQDKKKKFTQAVRQPISALFALGFQLPATMIMTDKINQAVYDRHWGIFKDEFIGDILPSEKHLINNVKKEEVNALEAKFEEVINGKSLRQELEALIRENSEEVGLNMPEDELAAEVKKRKENFLKQKVAKQKYNQLMEEKLQEIINNPEKYPKFTEKLKNIEKLDFVTEDYMQTAAQKFKPEFDLLEKEANLSFWDRTVRILGYETKKLKELKDRQTAFKKERGLKLLLEDCPDLFKNNELKVKKLFESYQANATKALQGKTFWATLFVNIFMVVASCYALNWAHPIVNKFLENKKEEKNINTQKVEVK